MTPGERRTGRQRKKVPGVSERMLTPHFEERQADGIVNSVFGLT